MYHHDPTRIPQILSRLREAWEGQPDLQLTHLWGALENEGITWGSSDAEVVKVLERFAHRHPPRVPEGGNDVYEVEVYSPRDAQFAGSIVVWPERSTIVVLRSPNRSPVAWRYTGVPLIHRSRPIRIADREGIVHSLGVAGLITAHPAQDGVLDGLTHSARRGGAWLVELADDSTVYISETLRITRKENRSLSVTERKWHLSEKVRIGKPLHIDGEVFATVHSILPVSFPRDLD